MNTVPNIPSKDSNPDSQNPSSQNPSLQNPSSQNPSSQDPSSQNPNSQNLSASSNEPQVNLTQKHPQNTNNQHTPTSSNTNNLPSHQNINQLTNNQATPSQTPVSQTTNTVKQTAPNANYTQQPPAPINQPSTSPTSTSPTSTSPTSTSPNLRQDSINKSSTTSNQIQNPTNKTLKTTDENASTINSQPTVQHPNQTQQVTTNAQHTTTASPTDETSTNPLEKVKATAQNQPPQNSSKNQISPSSNMYSPPNTNKSHKGIRKIIKIVGLIILITLLGSAATGYYLYSQQKQQFKEIFTALNLDKIVSLENLNLQDTDETETTGNQKEEDNKTDSNSEDNNLNDPNNPLTRFTQQLESENYKVEGSGKIKYSVQNSSQTNEEANENSETTTAEDEQTEMPYSSESYSMTIDYDSSQSIMFIQDGKLKGIQSQDSGMPMTIFLDEEGQVYIVLSNESEYGIIEPDNLENQELPIPCPITDIYKLIKEDDEQFNKIDANTFRIDYKFGKSLLTQETVKIPLIINFDQNTGLITQVTGLDPDTEESLGSLSFTYQVVDNFEEEFSVPEDYSPGNQEEYQMVWELLINLI
jgi:hypothetical protein